MGLLRELHETYKDRAAFLFIHIDEGGDTMPELVPVYRNAALDEHSPTDRRRRIAVAMRYYHLTFPCLVDTEEKQVERAYGAWPERLVIVDVDGRIAFDAGRGMTIMTIPHSNALDPGLTFLHWNYEAIADWLKAHTVPGGRGPRSPQARG